MTTSLVADLPQQASATQHPERVWATLAPLIAARPSMRLWSAQRRFGEVRRLTSKVPEAPAAVPIYNRGCTRMLVFDLDATRGGPQAVLADCANILGWLKACGGRAIVDHSTSGGCHVLVPLDRAVKLDTLRAVLSAAARQCPTLDVSPMLNPASGCITVPGAACKQGGHRRLLGLLSDAVDVLQHPNPTSVLVDLQTHLGAEAICSPPLGGGGADDPISSPFFSPGPAGPQLAEKYWKRSPMPAAVSAFAESGTMPRDGRWRSRSEARLSVLTHALWRGYTLSDIHHLIQPHEAWSAGLGLAYQRYRSNSTDAMASDWSKAQQWLNQALPRIQACTHKKVEHTGGATHPTATHARWLAHALWWCDTSLRSTPHRWAVAAVLQGLAISGARAGHVINGVVVVAVGGRSLSIAAGLISESSVWSALRLLRDTPGSPVLLVRKGRGVNADRYALTTPDVQAPDAGQLGGAPVAQVHPVWSMIGLQYRRLFEVVAAGVAITVEQVAATARVSRSSAYDGVAELCRIGLVRRHRGHLELGDVSLDVLGERLGVEHHRAARIEAHRQDRVAWRRYLAARADPVVEPEVPTTTTARVTVTAWDLLDGPEGQDYLAAVMATGPPTI